MTPSPPPSEFGLDAAQPLHGVVVCCTSISPEQRSDIEAKVVELGGRHKQDLTLDATHLIVGDYDTPKYRHVARERPDIKAMDAAWIYALSNHWKRDDEIDFAALEQTHRLQPLERGCVPASSQAPGQRLSLLICLTGFGDERSTIAQSIASSGGRHTGDLTRKCSHLIVCKPEGKKYQAAQNWKLHTVTLGWLHQSIARGMILDEARFDPLLPPHEQGVGATVPRPVRTKRPRRDTPSGVDDGSRKLRKTASIKLKSQKSNLWDDILGETAAREPMPAADSRAQCLPPQPTTAQPPRPDYAFAIAGFDDERHRRKLHDSILSLDGALVASPQDLLRSSAAHRLLVVPQTCPPDKVPPVPGPAIGLVTELYVETCLHAKAFAPPGPGPVGRPFPCFPLAGLANLAICSAGFAGMELSQVARIVAQLGARYEEQMRRSTSLLVCKSLQAVRKEKLRFALKWRIPVVSADWLWH
ncbi:hypothetical protein CDD82_5314 [Ophiocordyceps australis]|uniref:BRCT domain-containing protein n=1 Tax=Ophiocordyceps australis TaxID=1399860 RepID=A0A2C5Z2W0_9HYPO|nr:hypothetical protein CDD82_5314 [Ophiocordyceps australis]